MIQHVPRLATYLALGVSLTGSAQVPDDLHSHLQVPSPRVSRTYPAPANLKVLSRNLTGSKVHGIMEQWSRELGVRCSACHLRDSEAIAPAGPHYERFADDSKPMKRIARIMYTMTLEINNKFITARDGVPTPVNCGTCHRGSIRPEPFTTSPAQPPAAGGVLQ